MSFDGQRIDIIERGSEVGGAGGETGCRMKASNGSGEAQLFLYCLFLPCQLARNRLINFAGSAMVIMQLLLRITNCFQSKKKKISNKSCHT